MKRNYQEETEKRVAFIRELLQSTGAKGIVFGNSGGKDSALVGILCKMACDNTVGIIMPCESNRNYSMDKTDGEEVAKKFSIENRLIDVTPIKEAVLNQLMPITSLNTMATTNINPRLRMTLLYAVAASENRLVAGTGNRSEIFMGYFTKWGDGGHDFNPIGDLTVGEIYEFLTYLDAPESIITKAPSAGLFDGQTDEQEMGITYEAIDRFILTGEATMENKEILDRYHKRSHHKRKLPITYGGHHESK